MLLDKRFRAQRTEASTAPIPLDSLNCSATFEVTGVEVAGPLYINDGDKFWVVIYTCTVNKTVHLEQMKTF